ncbi:hypothetical protein [Candidatus Nitrosotenuis uzonensis]|nr:hypothetical protein [Candidatus Nitrosotenuis uzonensis]
MKNLLSLMALVVSVVMGSTVLIESQIGVADAAKSTGTKNQPFGKNAPVKVCGDQLCALNPSISGDSQPMASDAVSLESILKQMDLIHKKHQNQLKEKWATLNADEKAQFSKKLQDMLKKMESMSMVEHMDKMMKDSKHGKEGHDMKGDHTKKEGHDMKGDHTKKEGHDMKGDHTKKEGHGQMKGEHKTQ